MNKEIIMSLNTKNEVELAINGRKLLVENNTTTSWKIFDLLDYNSGDKFLIINKVEEKNMTDVFKVFLDMLTKLFNQINEIESTPEMVDKKLAEVS